MMRMYRGQSGGTLIVLTHHLRWVRALQRAPRSSGRTVPAAMDLLRRRVPRWSTRVLSNWTALTVRPTLQLSFEQHRALQIAHQHHRSALSTHNLFPTALQQRRVAGQPVVMASSPATSVFSFLVRILPWFRPAAQHVETRSFIDRVHRTFATPATTRRLAAEIAPVRSLTLVHRQLQRVEESISRVSTELAVRKQTAAAAANTRDASPLRDAFPQTRPANSPPDTVHVAAWHKASLPMPGIEQLADQVIRQIDRRMIAFRERMGRV